MAGPPSAQEAEWARPGAGLAPFNREWVTQLEPISSLLPTVRWAPALLTSRSWEVPTTPAQVGRGHRRKEPQPQALVVT